VCDGIGTYYVASMSRSNLVHVCSCYTYNVQYIFFHVAILKFFMMTFSVIVIMKLLVRYIVYSLFLQEQCSTPLILGETFRIVQLDFSGWSTLIMTNPKRLLFKLVKRKFRKMIGVSSCLWRWFQKIGYNSRNEFWTKPTEQCAIWESILKNKRITSDNLRSQKSFQVLTIWEVILHNVKNFCPRRSSSLLLL
jgi:hypothetical protein